MYVWLHRFTYLLWITLTAISIYSHCLVVVILSFFFSFNIFLFPFCIFYTILVLLVSFVSFFSPERFCVHIASYDNNPAWMIEMIDSHHNQFNPVWTVTNWVVDSLNHGMAWFNIRSLKRFFTQFSSDLLLLLIVKLYTSISSQGE